MKYITDIINPPIIPLEAPDRCQWASIETSLNLRLPEDYREFVATYGTGAVDSFLWVLNPFSKNENLNLVSQVDDRLDAQRRFFEESGKISPYPLYPSMNGLLPWGVTDNGDVLYWQCKGSPSAWPTIVCDGRSSRWQETQLSFSQFLIAVVTKTLTVEAFPVDFPSDPPEFISV